MAYKVPSLAHNVNKCMSYTVVICKLWFIQQPGDEKDDETHLWSVTRLMKSRGKHRREVLSSPLVQFAMCSILWHGTCMASIQRRPWFLGKIQQLHLGKCFELSWLLLPGSIRTFWLVNAHIKITPFLGPRWHGINQGRQPYQIYGWWKRKILS